MQKERERIKTQVHRYSDNEFILMHLKVERESNIRPSSRKIQSFWILTWREQLSQENCQENQTPKRRSSKLKGPNLRESKINLRIFFSFRYFIYG